MRSRTAAGRRALTVTLLSAGLVGVLAGCVPAPAPTPSGTPSASSGPVDPFSVVVGDCIEDELAEGDVMGVPVVDCEQPHLAEAYHAEELPDGDYPGLESVKSTAVDVCLAHFEEFAGISYDASQRLDFAWYYPTEGSWSNGDHEILCLMLQIDPATGNPVQTTGTLEGLEK
jgi:hypothetical protein